MNSIKSGLTVLFLLGVSYGVYTLVNTPDIQSDSDNELANVETKSLSLDQQPDGVLPKAFDQPDLNNRMDRPRKRPNGFKKNPPRLLDSGSDRKSAPLLIKPDSKMPADKRSPNRQARSSQFAIPPAKSFDSESDLADVKSPAAANNSGAAGGINKKKAGSSGIQNIEGGSNTGMNRMAANQANSTANIVKSRNSVKNAEASSTPRFTDADLDAAWPKIDRWVREGKVREPLAELSRFYHAELTGQKRAQLVEWLDALAFKVIYSTEHHLNNGPYIVQSSDTLESVAKKWNVPPALVFNVNQAKIGSSKQVTSGIELKVIPGPFRAEVDTSRQEMTLFLENLYAGRFSIQIGDDTKVEQGEFQVKTVSFDGSTYAGAMGQQYDPGHPNNPYGKYWMDLGNELCIHSTSAQQLNDRRGCISLQNTDAQDVFGILSQNSRIEILR